MKFAILFLTISFVSIQLYAQDSSIVFNQNRQIQLEGGSNFRDLGGYPTKNGKTVAWHKLYRSADISKLTENDLAKLTNLHIATVCDFRGPSEIKSAPDKLTPAMHYINLPAGSEKVGSVNYKTLNADSMMTDLYTRTDFLKAKYAPMFAELLKMPTEQAFVYHCTAGKDRTGIATALILSALGVDRKYIVADYVATNVYWKNTREKMASMMMKGGIKEEIVQKMLAADPTYIEMFLKNINAKYSSMRHFLKIEMGLTRKNIKQLKALYVQ